MEFRPIGPEELDRFCAAGARPEGAGEVREYVDRMVASGAMRPGWCFLAERHGTVVGRVAFWTLPARALGAEKVGHVVDAPPLPPFWQDEPERRVACLELAGFVLLRETRRFSWDGQHVASALERLTYRSIEETGDEAFVAAIAAISEGSLDQRDQEERTRLGPEGA